MRILSIYIKNFKSIRSMEIEGIEQALILVGKNNTGKTSVVDAVRAAFGLYPVSETDFNEKRQKIEIGIRLQITEEDLHQLHQLGKVSMYKRYEVWKKDFCSKLPSFQDGVLSFDCVINWKKAVRYRDGYKKDNPWILQVLPKVYHIDTNRRLSQFQEDLLMFREDAQLEQLRENSCMFDPAKHCNKCFQCIGLIDQKTPEQMNIFETVRLLEYKMYQLNLRDFEEKLNRNYRKNGGYERIRFAMNCNQKNMFQIKAEFIRGRGEGQKGLETCWPIEQLSNGMRSLYMLSMLETYTDEKARLPSIIIVEDPEIFLHPQLQKASSEILYHLSKKNQVIFTTHSPNLLSNFTSRQIRQIVLDSDYYSVVNEKADIDVILDNLGYGANDFMNTNFVFIVEGKQDKSRLPLLLEKYYSEIYDETGRLQRISIITTNSCTNIKTYANLKYMNQVYIRDQFLMIRDGDGLDPEELAGQLCRYYEARNEEDVDKLPRITRRNVLILKYYSFENYFLNPQIMARLGIVESEEAFYQILLEKWKEYLYRLKSGRKLRQVIGCGLESPEDVQRHMEEIRIYLRGHNLYDIFYGPYKKQETKLLKRYIELAPRDDFKDILDAVDEFAYFDSRKAEKDRSES
ncbi:MAG: AAA family ATPase [Lachnospiraceae bacterium]|nr:AAA family ATPase [Lachnospiraceae bacterium]